MNVFVKELKNKLKAQSWKNIIKRSKGIKRKYVREKTRKLENQSNMSNIWIADNTEREKRKKVEWNSSKKQAKKISKNSTTWVTRPIKGPAKMDENRPTSNYTVVKFRTQWADGRFYLLSKGKKLKCEMVRCVSPSFLSPGFNTEPQLSAGDMGSIHLLWTNLERGQVKPDWAEWLSRGGLNIYFLDCSLFRDIWIRPQSMWPVGVGPVPMNLELEGDCGWACMEGWHSRDPSTKETQAEVKFDRNSHKKQIAIAYVGGAIHIQLERG